jgi:hypothetical protein
MLVTLSLRPSHRRNPVSARLFTFRLAVLLSLALTAAANGGWKWTGFVR